MKALKLSLFISLFAIVACNQQSENTDTPGNQAPVERDFEIVEGIYAFNDFENEPYLSPDSLQPYWVQTMDSLNVNLIERYLQQVEDFTYGMISQEEMVESNRTEEMAAMLEEDPYLSRLPERIMFNLFIYRRVYDNGMLFNPCISLVKDIDTIDESSTRIYMTKDQLAEIEPQLGTNQKFNVDFIGRINYFNISLYQLRGLAGEQE